MANPSEALSQRAIDHVMFAARLGAAHETRGHDSRELFTFLVMILAHYDSTAAAACLTSLEAILDVCP